MTKINRKKLSLPKRIKFPRRVLVPVRTTDPQVIAWREVECKNRDEYNSTQYEIERHLGSEYAEYIY